MVQRFLHCGGLLLLMATLITGAVWAQTDAASMKDPGQDKASFEAWRIATDQRNEAKGVVGQPRALGTEAAILEEGFEGASFPPTGWTAVVVAGTTGWTTSTSYPHTGTKSAYNTYQSAGTLGSKWLISKRVNLVGTNSYTLTFWIRRGFTSVYPPDTVYVRLSTTDSLPSSPGWTQIYKCYTGVIADTIVDPNIYTANYRQFSTTITGVTGTAWIAFDHQDDDGQSIYLDDVLLDLPVSTDASTLALNDPAPGGIKYAGVAFAPVATFKNTGSAAITSPFNVRYQILDGSSSIIYNNQQPIDSLAPGSTRQITFLNIAGGLAAGTYTIRALTDLPGDQAPANDTLTGTLSVVNAIIGAWSGIADYAGGGAGGIANFWWEDSGKAFLAGGSAATLLTNCYFYDPVSNTYTPKASLPVARGYGKMVKVRNYLYLVGSVVAWPTPDGALYRYDPATDTWATMAAMPTALMESGVCVWNDSLIVAIGGTTDGWVGAVNSVYVYNPATNTWTLLSTPLPSTGMTLSAECIGNEIIVLGGIVSGGTFANIAYRGTFVPGAPPTISWRATTNPYGVPIYRGSTGVWGNSMVFGSAQLQSGRVGQMVAVDITDSTTTLLVPVMPNPILGNIPNLSVHATPGGVNFYMFGGYDGAASLATSRKYSISLAANDLASSSVDDPPSGGGKKPGVPFGPKATFTNLGTATQTGIPVRMKIFDGSSALVYTDNQTIATLASYASQQVTFANFTPATSGTYTARAIALNPGDGNGLNDSIEVSFTVLTVVSSFPYSQDFETGAPGWNAASVSAGANDWVLGTPAKTYITGPHGGTTCWVTKTTGNYSTSHNAAIYPPIMDFSAVGSDPVVAFYHNFFTESGWDGGVLEYSLDEGATWSKADPTLGTPPDYNTALSTSWYCNSSSFGPLAPPKFSDTSATKYPSQVNGWVLSTTTLTGAAGQGDVRLRWRFASDGSIERDGGWAIDDVSISVGAAITTTVAAGWNMISNPVTTADDSVTQLFPTSSFPYAFAFVGGAGYQQRYVMENGPGYWGKFPGSATVPFTGTPRLLDTVDVLSGWNMVGSVSAAVDTPIASIPPGIQTSAWYGFSGGYNEVGTLLPGKGYWVKAGQAGSFILASGPVPARRGAGVSALEGMNTLTVKDGAGHSRTLYFGAGEMERELPPLPPEGAFDVRFETAAGGAVAKGHEAGAVLPVSMQSLESPVTVSWSVKSGSYTLDAGEGLKAMVGEGTMTLKGTPARLVLRSVGGEGVPAEYVLLQNYPNPFNPVTTVRFGLPVESRVVVEVYNALGQRVKVLVDGTLGAGYHGVEWNGVSGSGQQAGSGVYFVRFTATGRDGRSMTDVRKAMLMK